MGKSLFNNIVGAFSIINHKWRHKWALFEFLTGDSVGTYS